MQKIRFADGTELAVQLVEDTGKQLINDVYRKVYAFHFLRRTVTYDTLYSIFKDETKTTHFDILTEKLNEDKTVATDADGKVIFEVIPDLNPNYATRDGFVLWQGIEAKDVIVKPADFNSEAIISERFVVTMAQKMVWER